MPESSGEKTEKATSHKRQEERKKGNVMQSKDVVTVLFIVIIFNVLKIFIKLTYQTVMSVMTYWVSLSGGGMGDNGTTIDTMPVYLKLVLEIGKTWLITAGPILLVSMMVSILGTSVQTKFLSSKESMKFKLDKLNPINGIKKMFSLSSIFELVKSIAKMVLLAIIVFGEIKKRIPDFSRMVDWEITASLSYMGNAIYSITMKIALVFVVIAVIDYMYQKWKWEKDMKMTKQEVKEEFKTMEGDPKIKSKRRHKQMEMAMMRMMEAVPEADVVIRNPTHFAVAIKYDATKNSAPVVVAKGADHMAMRIIKVAEEHKIPLVENRPLARALHDNVKLEREIPADLYAPVAEVLSFVYKLKNKSPY